MGSRGGILAMHDTIKKKGPKRVLWESVFRSGRFQEIVSVDNITAFRIASMQLGSCGLARY